VPPSSSGPPTPPDPSPGDGLDAGDLGTWLVAVEAAIAGLGDSDVPCGTCTACCTSSQFVHIGPDETATLAHVPRELTFPAPGLPTGHVLLGYDERGHCPMLVDGSCSIYSHRPRTCRTYDCRVFAAAGVAPDEQKVEIARRADRWRFRVATASDRSSRDAVRTAAAFLRDHAPDLASRSVAVPDNPTQLAVLAIEVHRLFLAPDDAPISEPALDAVAEVLRDVRERHRPT
jgi:Fe-S-cluster containining protein